MKAPDGGQPVVRLDLRDGVATITLDRPAKKNALAVEDMGRLAELLGEAQAGGARAILLRGAGGSFCAGRDLDGVDPATDDTLTVLRKCITPVLEAVRRCPLPTVASVEGPALGFGFGLAMACDIVQVSETARLGSPFRAIGLVLDSGGHHTLRERLGRAKAIELIMTGRLFSGLEAARMGLVNQAYPAPELAAASERLARDLAQGPTLAFAASKRILDEATTYAEVCEMEAQAQAQLMRTRDATEGLAAFRQKRTPRFTAQ